MERNDEWLVSVSTRLMISKAEFVFAGYSLRVPAEAMDALNRTSIPLNDGSGDVWAVMSVSHHLHCLVRPETTIRDVYTHTHVRIPLDIKSLG